MISRQILKYAPIALLIFLSFSCEESLPVYILPNKVIEIKVTKVEQLNDHIAPPNRPLVHIVIQGENIYDEVFWDSVDIKGSMRIWWKRKPVRYRTIYLTEKNLTDRTLIYNRKMMLLPGQRFSLDVYWNVRTDDGIFLPNEMDFAYLIRRYCEHNVACGSPEDFVIEVSLNIYNRLGYLIAPVKEFIYRPRACVVDGFPPCV
ncbi:MAG: hypothetical protein HY800_02155 [Ignavibacteriales bacterium]|nr:hypothetical protein [Ignavibacteriales bacterium]